jgi:hypothetical protein
MFHYLVVRARGRSAVVLALVLVLGAVGCGPSGSGTPPSLGGDLSVWYVAPQGSDAINTCHTVQSPCQTIRFAIVHAYNGAVVHIAAGTYDDYLSIDTKGIDLEGAGPNTIITHTGSLVNGGVVQITCHDCYSLVTLANLTIENGTTESLGGAVYASDSKLTMKNVTISGSSGRAGGGLYIAAGATAILDHVTIENNQAADNQAGYGGGIFNAGHLTMTNSTISGNSSVMGGGGIYNLGNADLAGLVVDGNTAPKAHGGGIYNYNDAAILTLTNSTLKNNQSMLGAGLSNDGGKANVTGTTFKDNAAESTGGGILNTNWAILVLINATVSGNTATFQGGGIANGLFDSILKMSNVTIANNHASKYAGLDYEGGDSYLVNVILAANSGGNCSLGPIGGGSNISSDASCNITGSNNRSNIDPKIGPLQNNGGPTETHALLAGSPAIDTGTGWMAPSVDQRGAPRPNDGNNDSKADYDVGAFEYGTVVMSWQATTSFVTATPGTGTFTFQTAGPCLSGPGLAYAVLAQGTVGEAAPVDGRTTDGSWFHLKLKSGTSCWVSGALGTFDGDPFGLPALQAPPTPTATATATATRTPLSAPFFKVVVKPNHIYYRGAGCGDKQAQFQVQVSDPEKVAGVWLFVRLKNKDSEDTTDWNEALVMIPIGSGWYSYTLLSEAIPNFTKFRDAWVQYQFVAYDKSYARGATSDVLGDVELSACGT